MKGSIDEVKDVLEALNNHNCKYMIIGGMAVNIHGYTRATGDLDIWYRPTPENINNLLNCVEWLGYETNEIKKSIKQIPETLIRLPIETMYVEFLPLLGKKFDFDFLYQRALDFKVTEQLTVKVIGYDDLIQSKINSHRGKDLEDISQLERRRNKTVSSSKSEKFNFENSGSLKNFLKKLVEKLKIGFGKNDSN